MADIIDVNIGDQVLEVFWQDEVELNLDMDLMYIKSGQKEIQDYVDNVSKPEINSYIETEAKPIVTEVVNTIAEPLVNEYMEGTVKPDIDTYTNEKLEAFNTNAATLVAEYNANATEKTDAFNTNASEKQAMVDASVAAATAQAGIATEQATAAANSATSASNYASNASAEADNAAESAGLAANSAAEANQSEEKAAEYLQQINNKITVVESAIGDIGFAPLGIDEAQNKRRYLNGQVISQAQFVSFTNKIKSAIELYPSLATTETNWQAEVTNSKLGQCGKFVIDDTAGTIRLPKVVNIQGLQDLALMGSIKAESLPNITGTATGVFTASTSKGSGAITVSKTSTSPQTGGSSYLSNISIDASRSSSTYQDGAPVQQEAVQYPYFIQVATGVEESVDVTREIELNNPYSLFDSKYSDHELNNLSWLKSEGQWNSKAVYTTAYDKLLKVYNGTETVEGLSVKLSTETYTDYDFVLNTAEETFRLPLLDGSESVISSKYIGLEVPANGGAVTAPANGWINMRSDSRTSTGAYYIGLYGQISDFASLTSNDATSKDLTANIPVNRNENVIVYQNVKDVSNIFYFRFIYAQGNGSLYFYVGETIQDANVIAASQVLTDVANLKGYDYVVESYQNGFDWYRVYKSGWIEQGGYHTFSSNTWEAVTLLKPMKNNRYMALLTGTGTAETLKGWKVGSENKNTSTTLYAICANEYGVRWYVSGQGT